MVQRERLSKKAPNGGVHVSINRPEWELGERAYDYVIVSEDLLGKKNVDVVEDFESRHIRRSHCRLSETQCVTGVENREREKRSDEQIRADFCFPRWFIPDVWRFTVVSVKLRNMGMVFSDDGITHSARDTNDGISVTTIVLNYRPGFRQTPNTFCIQILNSHRHTVRFSNQIKCRWALLNQKTFHATENG